MLPILLKKKFQIGIRREESGYVKLLLEDQPELSLFQILRLLPFYGLFALVHRLIFLWLFRLENRLELLALGNEGVANDKNEVLLVLLQGFRSLDEVFIVIRRCRWLGLEKVKDFLKFVDVYVRILLILGQHVYDLCQVVHGLLEVFGVLIGVDLKIFLDDHFKSIHWDLLLIVHETL